MKKNDIFTTEITSYTSEGMGICRINDTVVFVPETAAGDIIEVRITKVTSSYAYGRKEKLIKSSEKRVKNICPVFPRCGGCDFRHISYEEELSLKKQRVEDVLHRIAGIDLSPEMIIGADNIDFYRNKAQFPVRLYNNSPELGFYRERSHDIMPIDKCFIQHECCEGLIKALKKWMNEFSIEPYDEINGKGVVRHLYTRSSRKTGDLIVCIVTLTDKLPYKDRLVEYLLNENENINGIVQCVNKSNGNKVLGDKYVTLYGEDFIYDYIGDLKFKVSIQSFFQVNTEQAYKLYSKAKEYASLTGNEDVIDLYCGTGTVGLFMADKAKSLWGIEIIPEAITDAKLNAELNNIKNADFTVADVTTLSDNAFNKYTKNTVIFIDPPRKGITDELIDKICGIKPLRVVYISCDPATMARDLKGFIKNGYRPENCCAIDMFPRTRHVESVVLMSRVEK